MEEGGDLIGINMDLRDDSDDGDQFGRGYGTTCVDDSFDDDSCGNRPSQYVDKPGKIDQKEIDSDDVEDGDFDENMDKKTQPIDCGIK